MCLTLQDDVTRVQQLDLGSSFELAATDLRDLGQTLNHLPIVAAIKYVIYQLKHVNFAAIQ